MVSQLYRRALDFGTLSALLAMLACASAGPNAPQGAMGGASDVAVAAPSGSPSYGDDSALLAGEPDPLFDDYEEFEDLPGFPDPLEGMNRKVMGFNRQFDRFILDPLTRGYGFIFPGPVKRCIRSFFANLNSPSIIVNDLLQLEWIDAGVATGRFVVNTTIGIVGLFDPATRLGMPEHLSDFGQTLAMSGAGSGPYMVIPILGPTTVRDGFGDVVDSFFRPTTYALAPVVFGSGVGISGVATREENLDAMKALEESAIDFYAVLRSAYYQNRMVQVWGRREDRREPYASRARNDLRTAESYDSAPDSNSPIFSSTTERSLSKPSRLSMAEYSERRRASSLTVPLR